MRQIPTELAARAESGAAALCHAWVVRRTDGAVMGFTDHDRDLEVEGAVCRAGSGWTAGVAEVGGGAVGTMAASGGLDDAAITEADVAAGVYDAARVELWRLEWSEPDLRVRLWAGRLARLRREGEAFVAEIEGPLAKLERVVGRTYGRTCDAVLGDGRCGVAAVDGAVCDKRWATCVGVFGNGANFQGFPGIPGDDFLTAHPVAGGRNDGGRR